MDLELGDKVAVVTGARKGIGFAITNALVGEGARVVTGSRTTDTLDGLEGVVAVPVDLAAPDGPALLVQRALKEHGRVDVLVNNVGAVRLRMEGFLGTSDEEFEWGMRMNFFQPDAATIDYGAAKAAVVNVRRRWPRSSGRGGFASTASHPGPSAPTSGSESTASLRPSRWPPASTPPRPAKRSSRASAGSPTGRFTIPEEVATLVVMLASERTGNVTGANYVIDGGLIKTT